MFSQELVQKFLEELRNRKLSPGTYNNYLKALKQFGLFLGIELNFKYLREIPTRRVWLPTDEQMRKAVKALKDPLMKAIFLLYATTGLRKSELLELKKSDVLWEYRAIISKHDTQTKKAGITFFNEEAEYWLKIALRGLPNSTEKLLPISDRQFRKIWKIASRAAGIKITPQILRIWHAVKLRSLGVPDSFIDIFQGRAPRSVLAKYYTPVGVQELKQVYDRAGLKILS